ncbi:hypothetical protein [Methanoregula sp.]|jgi:hypothetical protein|uniref:hypothetical protein n=1 Tax=Methanoregula sp. TaxID=2052170 RepID=UPI0025EB262F|nr:hypothetical protein [Methanoregula sp.]
MTTGKEKEYIPRRYWGYILIISGALIGSGLGLLAGYPGPGVLTGLGLGFFGSAFINPVERVDRVEVVPASARRLRWVNALIGTFFIVFGMGIVWALFPYIIAVFIILLVIWILVHGFAKPHYISLKK